MSLLSIGKQHQSQYKVKQIYSEIKHTGLCRQIQLNAPLTYYNLYY